MSRVRFVLGALVALALLGAGCSSSAGQAGPTPAASKLTSPVPGGNFVMATSSDLPTMDPAQAGFDFVSWSMTIAVYSALLDYGHGLHLQGDLAANWKLSPDGKTYTFHLRPGLVFSDGTPLTSSDVRFSLERILNPKTGSPGAYLFDSIVGASAFAAGKAAHVSGIQTPNPSIVVIKLTAPESYFANILAMPYARVMDPAQVAKYGKNISQHPLGSGPFKLQSWVPGQMLVLVKNARYYDAKHIYLNSVTVKLNQNDQTRILEFQRGELSISDIPSAAFQQIAMNPKYSPYIVKNQDPDTYYIGMKNNQRPFNNVLVRRALNYAVNKARLVQLLNGRAIVSHGVIPPPMAGYDPTAKAYPYDPAKARRLLAQAGYRHGFSTEIWTINDETSIKIVQSVAADLAAVGVKAAVRAVDSSTFFSNVGDAHKVPMFLTFWWQDYPDPYDFFSSMLTKANWGPTNSAYYSDPVVERDVAATAHSLNQASRVALFRQMNQVVFRDAPWIFLYHTITEDVRQPGVYFYIHPVHIWRFADYWIGK
jgi:oligopeptide transport system substrate-binding protein